MAETKKTMKKKMPKASTKSGGRSRSKVKQLTESEIEEQSIADALESIRAIEESVSVETGKETEVKEKDIVSEGSTENVTTPENCESVSEAIPEVVEENENGGNVVEENENEGDVAEENKNGGDVAEDNEDGDKKRETGKKDYAEKALFDLRADIDGSKKKQQLTTRQLYGYDHMGMIYD